MMNRSTVILFFLFFLACEQVPVNPLPEESGDLYFPPKNSSEWQSSDPESLGWNTDEIPALVDLLANNNTRAFILLKDGKIVMEEYFGEKINSSGTFDAASNWYWASAAKTLTAFMVGMAQHEGHLDLQDKSSDYLGKGWTSLSEAQEEQISIWHQMSMTSGLDDGGINSFSWKPEDLNYLAEAGSRWAYHNAPYTLLDMVVENAAGKEFESYFNEKLRDRIGMDGFWTWVNDNHLYFSTARSMARYGLLILNKGIWENETILGDPGFMEEMINPSQSLNESYGYLWWLNGKNSYMLPQSQGIFPGSISPDGPDDMVSGIGKNSQYVSIVPSQNLVLVRMGDNPEEALVPLAFQNDIWKQLNKIIP